MSSKKKEVKPMNRGITDAGYTPPKVDRDDADSRTTCADGTATNYSAANPPTKEAPELFAELEGSLNRK